MLGFKLLPIDEIIKKIASFLADRDIFTFRQLNRSSYAVGEWVKPLLNRLKLIDPWLVIPPPVIGARLPSQVSIFRQLVNQLSYFQYKEIQYFQKRVQQKNLRLPVNLRKRLKMAQVANNIPSLQLNETLLDDINLDILGSRID